MRYGARLFFLLGCFSWVLCTCGQEKSEGEPSRPKTDRQSVVKQAGNTIAMRIGVPTGFIRASMDSASFASYLRNLPLKPVGSLVRYYNGEIKPNRNVYEAVVDLPIGKRDLHQCADAVMRLRAEYLFQNQKFDSIHFNFTNGFKAEYAIWRKGNRIAVNRNQVSWRQNRQAVEASGGLQDSPKEFWKYLEMVFSYAGTASLEKEMKSVALSEIRIGDVFIQGGFPGHAVIVVDMAIGKNTNEKIFLLAQSYMPAQEIQLLKNKHSAELNPWYRVSAIANSVRTPEWEFKPSDLKRFSN